MPFDVVFMGTPEFAVPSLLALIEEGHQIVGVVTQPDKPKGRGRKVVPPPVKEVAAKFGLRVLQPRNVSDPDFLKSFFDLKPEIVVVVAFGQKIPSEILRFPKYGCVNLHGSLLPRYRGAAPIQRAIMNGERETGVTTMYVTEEWDAGDIIFSEKVDIPDDMTGGELHDELAKRGARLLVRTLRAIQEGNAPRIPQDPEKVTLAPKLRPEEMEIDWSAQARRIANLVRAMNPSPGAYTFHNGRLLKVWRVESFPDVPGQGDPSGRHYGATSVPAASGEIAPGTVVEVGKKGGFTVKTGEGLLLIKEVQPQDGRKMAADEYMRGHPVRAGEVLGRK